MCGMWNGGSRRREAAPARCDAREERPGAWIGGGAGASRPRRRDGWIRTLALLAALAGSGTPAALAGQTREALPFQVGEELTFRVSVARLGSVGRGVMRVDGLEDVRGRQTYRLRFDVHGRLGLLGIEDRATSWFDPQRRHSLRYRKHERNPVNSRSEEVEMFPAERRWSGAGAGGAMLTDAPLDELSFLYHVRTLPLRPGDSYTIARHFDTERNPVSVRVVGRDTVDVPAGRFAVIAVEMRVRDGERFRGTGMIRLLLSDDAHRVPVQMESSVPVIGRTVMRLESSRHAIAARIPAPGAPPPPAA
jgi:hypothetical protein